MTHHCINITETKTQSGLSVVGQIEPPVLISVATFLRPYYNKGFKVKQLNYNIHQGKIVANLKHNSHESTC